MRNAKIMSLCGAAALSILLGGCFTTSDTPFTLVNGDTPHLKTGTLSCKGSGNDAKEERKQFVELRSGANVQYALVGETDTTVEPFVFYQVKGDRYIVVQAGPDSGEVLYVADVTDSAITVFDDAVEAEQESVTSTAAKHGVSVKLSGQSWTMSGPLDAQRKFMIDIADAWPSRDAVYKCAPVAD